MYSLPLCHKIKLVTNIIKLEITCHITRKETARKKNIQFTETGLI